ncbi:unnamed protein product [Allacma fusca]|uniref:Uncharacterized protein n=1 Tax=Allacma fusca TaxID=39272 RepID=A0A8J2JXJ2_9HEXA|nr:unnamed protein product [Allacma fusca]
MWPLRVSALFSPGRLGRRSRGRCLLLRQASTSISSVLYSSKLSGVSPMNSGCGFFADLTTASHKSPVCGAAGGFNLHYTFSSTMVAVIFPCDSSCRRKSIIFRISLFAPTKLVSLSLWSTDGSLL